MSIEIKQNVMYFLGSVFVISCYTKSVETVKIRVKREKKVGDKF